MIQLGATSEHGNAMAARRNPEIDITLAVLCHHAEGQPMTRTQIALATGLTLAGIHRIEHRALRKLQLRARQLRETLSL